MKRESDKKLDFRHKKTAPNARFDTEYFLLTLTGGRFGQTKVLSPDRNHVVSRFAETSAAHNGSFTHLDGAISGFDVLAAHRAFLLSFRIHFSHLTFHTRCVGFTQDGKGRARFLSCQGETVFDGFQSHQADQTLMPFCSVGTVLFARPPTQPASISSACKGANQSSTSSRTALVNT